LTVVSWKIEKTSYKTKVVHPTHQKEELHPKMNHPADKEDIQTSVTHS